MLEKLLRNLTVLEIQNFPFLMKILFLGINLDGVRQNVLHKRTVAQEQFNQLIYLNLEPKVYATTVYC